MSTPERSYIVILNDQEDANKAATDIQSLAKKENCNVEIGKVWEGFSMLQISCKDAFAEAVRKLPTVMCIEEEKIADVNDLLDKDKKPGLRK